MTQNFNLGLLGQFINVANTGNTVFTGNVYMSNSFTVPLGNTTTRPAGNYGNIRYNTETNSLEFFGNTDSWANVGSTQSSITSSSITTSVGVIDLLSSQKVSIVDGISVGNSTVNTAITSSTIFSGNTFGNAHVSIGSIGVANSTSNSLITTQVIFTGNTQSNASINLVGGRNETTISKYSISSTGLVTFNTVTDHGLQAVSGVYASFSNFDRQFFNNPRILISEFPSSNSLTFSIAGAATGKGLKIISVRRVNGLTTYYTEAAHGLLAGDVITITGVDSKIDRGALNYIQATIYSTPTGSSFTIYDSTKANIVTNLENRLYIPVGYSFEQSGPVYAQFETTVPHNYVRYQYVIINGIDKPEYDGRDISSYFGRKLLDSGINGRWQINYVASATSFRIKLFDKAAGTPAVIATNADYDVLTDSGTVTSTLSLDIASIAVTTPAYSTLPIATDVITNNGNITLDSPIYISVSNTASATKITPTSIFIGELSGNNVVIDGSSTRYRKSGSILQTTVDGSGIVVQSVLSNDGAQDPESAAFSVNTSVLSIGTFETSTVITQEVITTPSVAIGQFDTQVLIDETGIIVGDSTSSSNTIITNSLASFAGDISVKGILSIDTISDSIGSYGTNNQILTSDGYYVKWANVAGNGYTGSLGYTGSIGAGYTGSAGTVGYNGSVGYTGSDGTIGYNGSTGYTGSAGFANGNSLSVNNFVITGAVTAGGSNGTNMQVLSTTGSSVYWATLSAALNLDGGDPTSNYGGITSIDAGGV